MTAIGPEDVVAGGPVDDFVGFDFRDFGGLGGVFPDFDVFFETEQFLFGIEHGAAVCVGDGSLAGEGENFEGKGERILEAREVAGDIVGGGGGRKWWRSVRVIGRHGTLMRDGRG